MDTYNSHYIPQPILRSFTDTNGKLSSYRPDEKRNWVTGKDKESIFAESGGYAKELEELLVRDCEEPFCNIIANKIVPAKHTLELTSQELVIVCEYLVTHMVREFSSETALINSGIFSALELNKMMQGEIGRICRQAESTFLERLLSINNNGDRLSVPRFFTARQVDEDRREHTAKTLLDNHLCDIAHGVGLSYLGIWDTKQSRLQFLLPDVGYTGNFRSSAHRVTRQDKVIAAWESAPSNKKKESVDYSEIVKILSVEWDYLLFPLTPTRALTLINPFYGLTSHTNPHESMGCGTKEMVRMPERLDAVNDSAASSNDEAKEGLLRFRVANLSKADVIFNNLLLLDNADRAIVYADEKIARECVEQYKRHGKENGLIRHYFPA